VSRRRPATAGNGGRRGPGAGPARTRYPPGMRQRSFLLLVGLCSPLATAGGAVAGCGSVVSVVSPDGGAGAHDGGHLADGGTGGGNPFDAQPDYVDPGCPDAGPPLTQFMCDPYHQHNGNCPGNEGCYIFSTPPQTPCGQEVYGATCLAQGSGVQGSPCGGSKACSAGFTCVVSGSGDQCVQLCALMGGTGCPAGLVCEPIDVQGFGGCL